MHTLYVSQSGNIYLLTGHSRNFNACIKNELRDRGTLEMSSVVLKTKERADDNRALRCLGTCIPHCLNASARRHLKTGTTRHVDEA